MADLESIERRLQRIENALSALKLPKQEKYFYSTDEVAGRLGLSKWYVRRLCSQGEIRAEKHPESGRLVDVSDMAKEAGYKYPVAMTDTVYQKCVAVPPELKGEQDEDGRLWDVLWMSRFRKIIPGSDRHAAVFEVLVQTKPGRKPETVRIKAVCGPGDTADPVITFMFPGED